jgi:aspartate racemase
MKRLGVVGGIGPESTIAYYRSILAAGVELGIPHPPVLINSIDLSKVIVLVEQGSLDALTEYLVREIDVLARADASVALLAANTPHIVFDDVERRSPIRLVSIVRAARDRVLEMGLRRVGLLGTRFTMRGSFYPDVFARAALELVPPLDDEQDFVHAKYMGELLQGQFLPATREALLEMVGTMKRRDGVEAVVLAGTELPLILTDAVASGIPLLDTTQIHAVAAARAAWSLRAE